MYEVTTSRGTKVQAPVIAIAGGLGCFEPRKPPLQNLAKYEDHGVDYIIKDPEKFRGKKVVVAGGGDSASGLVHHLGRYRKRSFLSTQKELVSWSLGLG